MIELLPDLKFILNVVAIQRKMREAHLKLCVPVYREIEKKVFKAYGLYNPVLAINSAETDSKPIITNDFAFDDDGRIFLLTGPNNGGKTVFMCALGITQIMAQIGMMIPADKLEISPASGIFVELPKYQNVNENGRLADECSKISRIFNDIDAYSLCLFDEVFSSTDPKEAVILSLDIVHAMSHLGARGIYSTHFHELSFYIDDINTDVSGEQSRIDFIVAGISSEKERTYKITRRRPEGKSYAKTIADKYGLSFESLIKKL